MAGLNPTFSQAQANAAAIFTTMNSSPPSTCPFRTVLTEDMIELHFFFNADIMEHAEELVTMEEQIADTRDEILRLETDFDPGAQHFAIEALNLRLDEELYDLEEARRTFPDRVLAEIEEVKTEYRQLAEDLCGERKEEYVQARQRLGNFGVTDATVQHLYNLETGNFGAIQYDVDEVTFFDGHDYVTIPRSELPEYAGASSDAMEVHSYEMTHTSYRLIEEGQSFVTGRERLRDFLRWAGRALVLELLTAGAFKYVTAIRLAAAAVEQAATMALRRAAHAARGVSEVVVNHARRYIGLPRHVRDDLDNIRTNRPRDDFEPDTRGANDQAEPTPAASQVDEVCVLC